MRFMEYRVPASLEQIRAVLAIPLKRTDSKLVQYLTMDEMRQSSMPLILARVLAFMIARCFTLPLQAVCECRNLLGCV